MALDFDQLVNAMISAAEGLGTTLWSQIQTSTVPELKKIATQIINIEKARDDFTPEGAQALLNLQVRAAVGVIVQATALAELDAQIAINTILAAVRGMVNQAIGFALIA